MNNPGVNESSDTRAPCHLFAAAGNCSGCQNEHHPNLNPALVGMVVPQQYRVPNEVGIACQGCIDTLRECDKKFHHPTDERDPCSECRHFGGDKVRCRIAPNSSYNDQVYRLMLLRSGGSDYKLLPFVQARSKGPMPAERVKADWQGQSAETLLAKGDFLPRGVRDCPRAFTVPARESKQRMKNKRFHANEAQRLSRLPAPPSFPPQWQGHPQHSFAPPCEPAPPATLLSQQPPVAPMAWVPQPGYWTPQYAVGYQAPSPQPPYAHMPYPQVPHPHVPYPHVPYPPQMPASLPQRPHLPALVPLQPPPPPPSSSLNSRHGTPLPHVHPSPSRRSESSTANQQPSKKKRLGYDGIFSTDALEREM